MKKLYIFFCLIFSISSFAGLDEKFQELKKAYEASTDFPKEPSDFPKFPNKWKCEAVDKNGKESSFYSAFFLSRVITFINEDAHPADLNAVLSMAYYPQPKLDNGITFFIDYTSSFPGYYHRILGEETYRISEKGELILRRFLKETHSRLLPFKKTLLYSICR